MFIEAYLKGLTNMVESKSDLERLRFMPQKIEGGVVTDFKGNILFKDLDINDTIIFDANRVNDTKRFTAALSRDYFLGLDKVMPLFKKGASTGGEATPKKEYGADLLECVANGDKKGLRTLLKDYKKTKWANLDDEVIEDAVFDFNDCAGDKDVEGAREILSDLICDDICDDICESETDSKASEEAVNADPHAQKGAPTGHIVDASSHTPVDEDEAELLADIEDAIADEDVEDIILLLKELGEKHPLYKKYHDALNALNGVTKEDTPAEDTKKVYDNIITEICEDIDAALADNDLKDAKGILEELADEVGEDSDVYKEYEAKVNPPKKERTRRSRRS